MLEIGEWVRSYNLPCPPHPASSISIVNNAIERCVFNDATQPAMRLSMREASKRTRLLSACLNMEGDNMRRTHSQIAIRARPLAFGLIGARSACKAFAPSLLLGFELHSISRR